MRNSLFGFGLRNGAIGVYDNHRRVWTAKQKHNVNALIGDPYTLHFTLKHDMTCSLSCLQLFVANVTRGTVVHCAIRLVACLFVCLFVRSV